MRVRMACSGSPGTRAAAYDLVEELLLALVQVGAQLDEVVRPQVDDAVVHLLVVVLAALLRHLWPAEGSGSRPSTAAVHAGRSHPAATWAYTRCRTGSRCGLMPMSHLEPERVKLGVQHGYDGIQRGLILLLVVHKLQLGAPRSILVQLDALLQLGQKVLLRHRTGSQQHLHHVLLPRRKGKANTG